jgi:hypothetical protein
MSCEGHRQKFHQQIATTDKKVSTPFGGAAEADAALEQVFQVARAQAAVKDRMQQKQAEAGCRALFAEMQRLGIKPPTHSASGLPKRDAQFGYAAVYQTLRALREGRPLPALARAILEKGQRTRQVSAVGFDAKGYYRCGNCGRFASQERGHTCPATATGETLNKALTRRLGTPPGAYSPTELSTLLDSARRNNGLVRMRHNLTGEVIEATLDGLPLALSTGFVPNDWQGRAQPVELADGRIVSVLNGANLTPVKPQSTAVGAAAAAYGVSLPANTPVASAVSVPPVAVLRVREATQVAITGGQDYDFAHFLGSEYRKAGSHGAPVDVYGHHYTVGERSTDQADWASARIAGPELPPPSGIVVGRTLVEAVGLLATGEVVETGDGRIEVYDRGRRRLLSAYDPQSGIAGDTEGNPNASAAQMAAIMAQRALHPQNAYDTFLATDLARMHEGAGTPLAAADGGYVALKYSIFGSHAASGSNSSNNTIRLGGTLSTSKCPTCGQFAGSAHICPGGSQQPPAPEAQPAGSEQPSAVGQPQTAQDAPGSGGQPIPVLVQPQVTVEANVDTAPIAEALRAAPAPQVQATVQAAFDAQGFAQALRQELSQLAPVAAPAAVEATSLTELRQAMGEMAKAVASLAQHQAPEQAPGRPSQNDERLAEVLERMGEALNRPAPAAAPNAAPSVTPAARPRPKPKPVERQPRSGLIRPEGLDVTHMEHIFSPATLPAPDPYLSNVPAHVGGQLDQPLTESIPALDPNYDINAQTESILRSMSSLIQSGAARDKGYWCRAFGLYGPAGTGKNTLARQLAASIKTVDAQGRVTQGLHYEEATIVKGETRIQELIGTAVLTKDPESGATVTKAELGRIGKAAAMGSVICINEIVNSPELAAALQSMLEDGEIQLSSPEGGVIKIPVHPATTFVVTWNPGYEGHADRPGPAPTSRMTTWRMDEASNDEKKNRVKAFFASFRGEQRQQDKTRLDRQIFATDYKVSTEISPTDAEIEASVRFFNEVGALAGGGGGGLLSRQIGKNSADPTAPGSRQLNRFIALGKTVGWDAALDMLKICCDQDEQFSEQWKLVRERFDAHFGADGGAVGRRQTGNAPQRS